MQDFRAEPQQIYVVSHGCILVLWFQRMRSTDISLRAIFWPTEESVIHAVAVPQDLDRYFQHSKVEKICMSYKNHLVLMQFISNSFYKTEQNQILPTKVGIYGDSQFYKGIGNYYLMNTCNKWTAKGLKSAGFDISTTFKLSAGSVMRYLEKHRLTQNPSPGGQNNVFSGGGSICG